MDIEAIPTTYAGVTFRSKLEATWARFFDVIGVAWEYEPTRLPGWVPDFLLDGWWLAEVKPVAVTGKNAAREPVFQKAFRRFDTVLLGDGPGDSLGLVVRRLADGTIFTRHLLAYMDDGPARLLPATAVPKRDMPLTAFWRGLVNASGENWEAVPFRHVAFESAKHFGGHAA